MVYPKKTWIGNEVITTAALNNIENGVETASKLSGTDIDVDKDWNGKAISNLSGLSGTVASLMPSTTVLASSPGSFSVSYSPGLVVAKTFIVPAGYWNASVRVIFKTQRGGEFDVLYAVAQNGHVYEHTRGSTRSSGIDISYDVFGLRAGDALQILVGGNGAEAQIYDARVCGTATTTTLSIGGIPGPW